MNEWMLNILSIHNTYTTNTHTPHTHGIPLISPNNIITSTSWSDSSWEGWEDYGATTVFANNCVGSTQSQLRLKLPH